MPVTVTDNATPMLEAIRARLARGLEPYAPELEAAARGMFEREFESGGALGRSGRWRELSPATMRRKGAGAWDVLDNTGELRASLASPESPYAYAQLSPDLMTLAVGTLVPYAPYHQFGTRNMPARPLVPDEVPEDERRRWTQLVSDRLLG